MVCLDFHRIVFMTHCLPQVQTMTLTSLFMNPVGHNSDPKCRIFPKFQKAVSGILVEILLAAPFPTCVQEQVICSRSIVRVDEPKEPNKQLEGFVRQWRNNVVKFSSLCQRDGFEPAFNNGGLGKIRCVCVEWEV